MVTTKDLDLAASWDHSLDDLIHLFGLLRSFANGGKDHVVTHLGYVLRSPTLGVLDADQANLARVQNIVTGTDEDAVVSGLLDPHNLFRAKEARSALSWRDRATTRTASYSISVEKAPLAHALEAELHLRVDDPQEQQSAVGQHANVEVHDLLVGERVVREKEATYSRATETIRVSGTLALTRSAGTRSAAVLLLNMVFSCEATSLPRMRHGGSM